MLLSAYDITEYKELEKKIEKSLVSYQEIHHRVKNNLQTIASLLQLQARRCAEDKKTVSILGESVNRILSIAVTHELLSKNNGDEASIMEVIEKLKENIVKFGLTERDHINIEVTGRDFLVSSDKATTIALIVNELIQNSLKHAYDKAVGGRILIKMGVDEEFRLVEVQDFGTGYDVNEGRNGSLGLQIVESYVYEKLKGRLMINTGTAGTSTVFVFK